MAETPDRRLAAITEALRTLPIEERVPGYGHDSMPGKADLLELLADSEPV